MNIPYYHRVITRNKYAQSVTANPADQNIMLSKQLPLVNRSKQSLSPKQHMHDHECHLHVQGEHQCITNCMNSVDGVRRFEDEEDYQEEYEDDIHPRNLY